MAKKTNKELSEQVDSLELRLKQLEEKGDPMPPEKQQALDIATSQGEING